MFDNTTMIQDTAARLLELISAKDTDKGDHVEYNDTAFFSSLEQFALEKSLIFKREPLFMGYSCEIPNSGDYMLDSDAGAPIMIVRDSTGKARAFLNACRHRGAKLLREPCGNTGRKMSCPYHAWTYNLEGKLLAIADANLFGEVDKADLGLIELPCEDRFGLIYVSLDRDIKIDIAAILGDRAEEFERWDLGSMQLTSRIVIPKPANWKLALDTYCENYHFPTAHRDSLAATKIGNCMATWRFGDRKQNHTITFPSKSIRELMEQDRSEWRDVHTHYSFITYLYPHTMLSMFPDYNLTWRVYPGNTPGESITHGASYARGGAVAGELPDRSGTMLSFIEGLLHNEDYPMAVDAQEACDSGLFPFSVYGRNEHELSGMHHAISEAVKRR